ncbi:murein hydrolase activator EnvC family protein [Faecalispora anaeroviscerum]|uniref:murein hydrolase activator EnvC family protein n=1 Tax=Faecalispora anaeroviscerum TaxID=2991836 RepID=UPI0024BADAB5|nr:M23 family metallopeptidase [Faecalispora anaeroviscerum]
MAGKGKRSVLALVLAVIVAFSWIPSGVQASSTINQLQQKQNELKKQQQATASKLKQLKADKAKQQEYKNTLDTQVQNVQSQIDTLNAQVTALDADIKEKESQIAEKQKSIDANIEQLKQRVRAIYLLGESSQLEVILGAQDVTDFLDKTELVRSISQHDQQVIQTLKADMASIKTQKEQIEQNRQSVAQAKKDLDTKNSELTGLLAESSRVLTEISANVVDTNSENNRLAAERKKVDAQVDQWYKDYYASIKNNNNNNQASGGYVSKGQFTWPVPGYTKLSSYWGDGRGHKGIDIAGSGIYGKAIVAADSGKVILANHSGWGGGYGLCAYLDHGGGYSTRYGHMSNVVVNTGDVVKKGQVIGYVGSTGDSSGPHLHFEIRVNGVAQNPMKWFG